MMGQADMMGQQGRRPLLPLCFAWLAGGKEEDKETRNQIPVAAVCGKDRYLGRSMEGLHEPRKR